MASDEMNSSEALDKRIEDINHYAPFRNYSLNRKKNDCSKAELRDLRRLNILVIGEPGVGKSSFISTLYCACNSVYKQPPIAVVRSNRFEQCTRRKKYYDINQDETLRIFDTKGIEDFLQSDRVILQAICTKKLKDDVELKQRVWGLLDMVSYFFSGFDPSILLESSAYDSGSVSEADLPHTVIVVIPASQRQIPREMRDLVSVVLELGYKPIFAISKLDEEATFLKQYNVLGNKKRELNALFSNQITDEQIMPIMNYTDWSSTQERNTDREESAITVLEKAIEYAEEWLEPKYSQARGSSLCTIS